MKELIIELIVNHRLVYYLINCKYIIHYQYIQTYLYSLAQKMGAAKTLANMYTYNEYLYYYINARDIKMVEQILQKRPNLIKDPLTAVSKVTALNQVATTNNLELCQLLVERYGADVNLASPRGETPLISAIRKNNVEMVKLLLSKGADPNYIDKIGLKTIQYAILQGLYQISYILMPQQKQKQLRSAEQYTQLGHKYNYRYVNYEMMLESLANMVEPEKVGNILVKKRIILSDPVIDPRETWKQWFARNLEFKDPPLVERASLPEELRPENRRFGKIMHFFGKMAMTPASQKPSYKPATQSQFQPIGNRLEEVNSQQIQMNSVA